jgi:sulfane dehydrogenase subunit SoxC
MNDIENARRRFLREGLAFAGLSLGGIPLASGQAAPPSAPENDVARLDAYGERSRFVTSKRFEIGGGPEHKPAPFGTTANLVTPLQDLVGIITPNSLHYVGSHGAFYVPDINPAEHRLMIHGMVDRPLLFTIDELKRFPSVSRIHYLECNANYPKKADKTVQEAAGRTSCAEWTGVPLSLLLKQAGVKEGAKWVIAEAADDDHGTYGLPIDRAMGENCIVAYAQNGEPVRPQNGYPLRLFCAGLEAVYSIKWLRRLQVSDEFVMTYMNHGRYMGEDPKLIQGEYEQGPKSIITFPSGGQQLSAPGHYEISGLAWSGAGKVRKVEVTTDGGQTWKDAEFRSEVFPRAHTRFGLPWDWQGDEHLLMSRCTDEKGQIQPTQAEFNNLWPAGATRDYAHPNFILPWRVGKDGKVENGLA